MDFSWTREQCEIYDSLVTQIHLQLNRQDSPADQFWARSHWESCANLALLGLCVPQDYGGKGYGALTTARAIEAFGYACSDMGLVFSVAAHLCACAMPIVEYSHEAGKAKWLPSLCSGTWIGANAMTEEDAGSDISTLKTYARRENDTYILEGRKSYVSNGPVADVFIVYAKTNPAHGYMGISAFVVEGETPGLLRGEPIQKIGLQSTPACRVTFNACRIPVTNRLGDEEQGIDIFTRSMQWERTCLFASYLGQMERQLERTISHTKKRRQFGKSLSRHQVVAHRLADMKVRLEGARLLLYRACWLLDQGQAAHLAVSLAKLAVSEAAIQSSFDAVHLHGAAGLDHGFGIEQMLRDALPSAIFSGASEVQRDIIACEMGL